MALINRQCSLWISAKWHVLGSLVKVPQRVTVVPDVECCLNAPIQTFGTWQRSVYEPCTQLYSHGGMWIVMWGVGGENVRVAMVGGRNVAGIFLVS